MRAALLGLLLAAACQVPADVRAEPYQRAFYRGQVSRAVSLLEHRLQRARGGPDEDVLRLDLASALAADGRHAQAAALLVEADERLETLDYSSAPLETLAAFVFSREPVRYRASRFERLLANTGALLAFLAAGATEDAAVEARRARVLLLQSDVPADERAASVLVWALAGVALERSGAAGEAADAFRSARALAEGDDVALAAVDALARRPGAGEGSLLVVVENGRAPVRVQAIVRLWVDHALRRVQLPVLVARPGGYARIEVELDGAPAGVPASLLDVASQASRRYDDELPRLLAAAVLAAFPRALLTDEARDRMLDEDEPDDSTRNILAELLAFLGGELLAEAFPADTRCWTLLPAEVRVLRLPLPAGSHHVAVTLQDSLLGAPARRVEWEVELAEGELAVLDCVTAVEEGFSAAVAPGEKDLTGTLAGDRALELLGEAGGGAD